MTTPIGIAELAEAVAGFIEEVAGTLGGRPAFHAKVAQNALAIISREARSDALQAEGAFYRGQTAIDDPVAAEADFCRRIRMGEIDADDELLRELSTFVAARLAVDNPKFSTLSRLKDLDE